MEFQLMRKDVITKTRAHSFFPAWVRQRELRQRFPLGHSDAFYKSLYSSISICHSWGGGGSPRHKHALASLEFSPDGTLLVAGCGSNRFMMFDPFSRRLIRTVETVDESYHFENSITKVKFLDSHIFATGNTERTVSLWDTRNLRSPLRTLWGYLRKTGNLEFSRKNNFLITSGYTYTICIWDMNNWKLRWQFNAFKPDVFRSVRLSPDETKMIISTQCGYLLIVHELDFNRIAEDMNEFASLLQASTTSGWNSSRFVFPKRRRNRVEIVADFPNAGRGVHKISSLEIHPQGWSVISRSRSNWRFVEVICVHDIQEKQPSERGVASRGESGDERPPFRLGAKRQRLDGVNEEQSSSRGDVGSSEQPGHDSGPQLPDAASPLERGARKRKSSSPVDAARARSTPPGPSSAPPQPFEPGSIPASSRVQATSLLRPNTSVAQFNRRVHLRFPRLTHYIDERYSSDWNVDSLGVSADGRVVCSPLNCGIRLLAFSPECSEQSVSWCGTRPRPLYELSRHVFHSDYVRCVRFSPRHCLLVSGSLDGKLVWYQPVV